VSRLGAALQRAATGVIAPREPQEPRVDDMVVEAPSQFQDAPSQFQMEEPVRDAVPQDGDGGEAYRFREFNKDYVDKLVVSTSVPNALREQYRRLAANLHHAQEEGGIKTLMITSAVPDEGKTLTATNIALTLSESYHRRVLLIDADLRRPSLDEVFMMPKGWGLNEALTGKADRKVSVIQVSRYLSLLPAGSPDPDPMSTLTSERMRRLIKEASDSFDWVIMDTPPIGILTDAKLLGGMVDAAVLVVRAGRTPAELIQRSVDSLGKNRIIGVVLNRAERRRNIGHDYTYDSYYYAYNRQRSVGER
jgi:capsular exopolysaccharide synthesis family protein